MKRHLPVLSLAAALWALTAAAAAFVPGALAKFTASAEIGNSASVAMWRPFKTFTEEHGGFNPITEAGDADDPAVLRFAAGRGVYTTTVTLTNRSEVAVRYVLTPGVVSVTGMDRQDFLDAVSGSIEANTDYNGGIVLPGGGGAELDIIIPAVKFTGLTIAAAAEQAD